MKRPANAVEPQAALVVQAVLAVLKAAPDVTTVGYADLLLVNFSSQSSLCLLLLDHEAEE